MKFAMKRHKFVTSVMIMNILLAVAFALLMLTRFPSMAARLGEANSNSVQAYQWTIFAMVIWIGSSGLFAFIGLFKNAWAIILSAILAIIFCGLFFLILIFVVQFRSIISGPRFIFFLVITGYPVVANFLAIIYDFKHRRRNSGEVI